MSWQRSWLVVLCALTSVLADPIQIVEHNGHPRNGVSFGFLPTIGDNVGSVGVGIDSGIVNAGIAAIALTAAAIITIILLPGISLSYGGSVLSETVRSAVSSPFFVDTLTQAATSRQLGLNGPGGVGLMTLFSVATDIYSKLDSDDVTCQKKIICEFMKDKKMFGTGANSVRSGIKYATSFLESWGVPYVSDIRDAASLNDQSGRSCSEMFNACEHVSLKESYDNSVKKVFNITEGDSNTPRKDVKPEGEEEYEYEYYDRK